MPDTPEILTEALLDAARRAGADAADAVAFRSEALSVEVRDGALEHAERAESTDIGLRVLIGHKQACIAASDTSSATLTELAERAVAMASAAPDDPYCGLADPEQFSALRDGGDLDLADHSRDAEPDMLKAMALEAEAAARAVPGVDKTDEAGGYWSRSDIHLATSNGFSGGYARTGWSVSAVAITGDGTEMERDYSAESRSHLEDLPEPAVIGREAGERTIARANPKRPPTGTYPVLFDERISSSLIGHLGSAINGSAVARGASFLKDAMGDAVLPDGMSLVEDPTRPRISGSRVFDGEGLLAKRRVIVEDGVLKSWTLDLGTGRQLGMASTGNASRGASAPPRPTLGNLELTPGKVSRDDLIRDLGTGLIVTSMIGSTINPTTGDYSRGAAGLWVENGEIVGPVNECTIAGNLRDMLRRIIPANDARTHLARQVPSLLVEGMTIAGA